MSSNDMDNSDIAHRPLAIRLNNFKFRHGPASDDDNENDNGLFIGRKHITDKLLMLLKGAKKKGVSLLVAGYRGAGKTSVVNRAIAEHSSLFKKPKWLPFLWYSRMQRIYNLFHMLFPFATPIPIVVRLNLANRDRLAPQEIFYSITNILRDELYFQVPTWIRRTGVILLFIFGIYPVIHYILLPIFVHAKAPDGVFIWPAIYDADNFLRSIIGITGLIILLFYTLIYSVLRELGSLTLRMENEITDERGVSTKHSGIKLGLNRKIKSLPLSCREVEYRLTSLINNSRLKKYHIIFVFDEIDKLSERDARNSAHHILKDRRSESNQKQKLVNELLGSLKSFITTTNATFIFISGHETLDSYYSERGSANSLYESLFDYVIEVPSLLTDETDKGADRPPVTRQIEKFLCARLGCSNGDVPFKRLDDYHKHLQRVSGRVKELLHQECLRFPLTNRCTEKENRSAILALRNFVNYLAFHSWGNPKRLSAIFESFVSSPKTKPDKRIVISGTVNGDGEHFYLDFTFEQQRSIALTSKIFTLFQHQLSREVSHVGDKLTVTALSSLQFILKLHQYGFTRESLHRMSEAFNIYRAPELNVIVDDLLRQVFKPYIRRIRNGAYRYRFCSSFEQEIRYITYVSDLESASYNFSLDAMRSVKEYLEYSFLADREQKSPHTYLVQARTHVSLGDMNAIEQSFNVASAHYSEAIAILGDQKSVQIFDNETANLYLEAMLKHGDLEEYRQNYGNAAAIYAQSNKFVEKLLKTAGPSYCPGDSKWEIYTQAYWANLFLSLKRSPSSNIAAHEKTELYRLLFCKGRDNYNDNPRYYYRYANLCFYQITYPSQGNGLNEMESIGKKPGNIKLAIESYAKAIYLSKTKMGREDAPNERRDYLACSALVGLVETILVTGASKLASESHETNGTTGLKERYRVLHGGLSKLLETRISDDYSNLSVTLNGASIFYKDRRTIPMMVDEYLKPDRREDNMIQLLDYAATNFRKNGLYISAVVAYFKIIGYSLIALDYIGLEPSKSKLDSMEEHFKDIVGSARRAMECIDLDRGVNSSQGVKSLVVYDIHEKDSERKKKDGGNVWESIFDDKSIQLTQLFEFLGGECSNSEYPMEEQAFWQSSSWGQKLAAMLYWAEYVRSSHKGSEPIIHISMPPFKPEDRKFSPSGNTSLSIRSSIMMRWVFARSLIDSLPGIDDQDAVCWFSCCNAQTEIKQREAAYRASRNLYYVLLDISLISRKNLDLVFPALPQVYLAQWYLLYKVIGQLIKCLKEKSGSSGAELNQKSFRNITVYVQEQFRMMDAESGGGERIAPSHFDYDYIYIQLQIHLQNSFNMFDQTSRSRTNALQQKYFAHDDHSDPEFRMDWTMGMMFSPIAGHLLKDIRDKHESMVKEFKQPLEKADA